MKTKTMVGIILTALLLSGCSLLPQVQAIKDQYVATRVAQELTKMPAVTEAPKETTPAPEGTVVATEAVATATLEVQATEAVLPTATAEPQKTATPAPTATSSSTDPAVYLGAAAWEDTFDSNREIWSTDTDDYLSAWIGNGLYNLTAKNKIQGWRIATTHKSLTDFYLEMSFITGVCNPDDKYGMIFRVPVENNPNQGYLLGLTCGGEFSLRKWDGTLGAQGVMTSLSAWKTDANIRKGADQTNRLGVMVLGSRFIIYINGVRIAEATDSAFTQGYFGVFAGLEEAQGFIVKLDRAAYWTNPVER